MDSSRGISKVRAIVGCAIDEAYSTVDSEMAFDVEVTLDEETAMVPGRAFKPAMALDVDMTFDAEMTLVTGIAFKPAMALDVEMAFDAELARKAEMALNPGRVGRAKGICCKEHKSSRGNDDGKDDASTSTSASTSSLLFLLVTL